MGLTATLPDGRKVKFGRIAPPVKPQSLHLARYLLPGIAPPPATCDYSAKVGNWPMYMNDQLGCCVISDLCHEVGLFTANEINQEAIYSNDQVVSLYSAIGGYRPGQPWTDHGCVIQYALNYWQATGAFGHKIAGYAAVDNSSQYEIQQGLYLFGAITLGIALPNSWINNARPGFVWDLDTPNPNNGHCIPIVAYDSTGVKVVTWGITGTITWRALQNTRIVDEAWIKISNDWVSSTTPAPNGLDMATLTSDLTAITLPPDPTPTPTPTPTPPPVPPPPSPRPICHPQSGADVNAFLNVIIGALEKLGGSMLESINISQLEQIVAAALVGSGPSGVLPALITNVNTWITNPLEAQVVVAILKFLQSKIITSP